MAAPTFFRDDFSRIAILLLANCLHVHYVHDGDYTYICCTEHDNPLLSGAYWMIARVRTTTGHLNLGETQFADGNRDFDNVATDPASLNYPAFSLEG